MIKRFIECSIAAICLACAFSASGRLFATGKSVDAKWTANGATACEKFLTPDVVSEILTAPAGPAVKDAPTSCHRGSIYITLKVARVDVFKQEMPGIVMAHPMTGIGDAAFWNPAGAMSSVKAPDRGCDVGVIGPPAKIKDEALGRKLGEICNKIFALQ